MTMKRFASAFALFTALALLVSCSTLDRIQRLNTEHALQRQNYLSGDAVNLWPFFFATGDYVSMLWPMIDWDGKGFAIRPLVNKENNDWSVLFPLAGWDSGNGDGWCALGYWNVKNETYGFFPIFHYSGKDDLKFAGPFWANRKSGGFFPIVWVFDDACVVFPVGFFFRDSTTVLPLFYADKDKFLSIPVSWGRKPKDEISRWDRWDNDNPRGFEGAKKNLDWRWYYALLWYGGSNDYRMIAQDAPGWEYAEALGNDTAMRNLYMRDHGKEANFYSAEKYVCEKLDGGLGYEAKEIWRGLFPFFHYETFFDVKTGPRDSDPYLFNSFNGLFGCVKRTPKQDLTHVFGPFVYLRNETRERGKNEVENRDGDLLWSAMLFRRENTAFREMTPEAAFRFQSVTRDLLEERLKLYLKKDIERWEKAFSGSQEGMLKYQSSSYIAYGTGLRTIYRTRMIPTPKTRQEVEALLAEFNDPKNYVRVSKSDLDLIPFFSRSVVTRDADVSTDTRTLFGLLSCFQDSKYEEFQHVFGPFGYLHSLKRQEGEYEHEKALDEFSMSLLAYRFSKDRWELKRTAAKRYSGVIDDKLRLREVLTDPKEIAEWEKNFHSRLDAKSELETPKTAAAAHQLLEEKNATANYEKNHESGYGLAPFFAHREHKDLTDTGVLLDLLFRYKRSPTSDITHLLGPFVFYSSRHSNDPDYACQKHEGNFFLSLLFYRGENEWLDFTDAAKKKFSAVSPYILRDRFRMTDPQRITQWEKDLNAQYWFADPENPRRAPASAAEAKALYQDYFDLANYQPHWKKYRGVFPFCHLETTDRSSEFNILCGMLAAGENSPEKDYFQIASPLGYLHLKQRSAPDAKVENRFSTEKTGALLVYSGTHENFVRSVESEKKYQDLPYQALLKRIYLGDKVSPKELEKWERLFALDVWKSDPRSTRAAPESLDAAKKLYLEYSKEDNYRPRVAEIWGMVPFVHRERSEVRSEFKLFGGILSNWLENDLGKLKKFDFHVLGPLFMRQTESSTGYFEHDATDRRFTLAGLLFYHHYQNGFVRTAAGEQQAHTLDQYRIENRLSLMPGESSEIAKWEQSLARANMKLDGTTAFPIPKNDAEAKKLWLDYNAPENFEANPYESFGFAPLFHYGSDRLGRNTKFVVPALLTWHTRKSGNDWNGRQNSTKTRVLAGLLYAGSSREGKNPLQAEWLNDLPPSYRIHASEKPFIEGDEDFEDASFSGSSSRFLLIAANNRGQAVFWKKGSPRELGEIYRMLENMDSYFAAAKERKDADWQKRHEKFKSDLLKLGLDPAKINTELGCAQLRKQMLDRWAEVRDMSERGRLGRLVYRYGRCGDDAAFWLGGGALAKYTRQNGAEDTSVLGFLYRSHSDAKSSSRIIFPFIAMHEDQTKSQFSFLWRLVNVEKKKDGGVSGHIFFIPF